jgi:ABC-type ATPase involved in cell division
MATSKHFAIRFERVSKHYGGGTEPRNDSFSIEPGSMVFFFNRPLYAGKALTFDYDAERATRGK